MYGAHPMHSLLWWPDCGMPVIQETLLALHAAVTNICFILVEDKAQDAYLKKKQTNQEMELRKASVCFSLFSSKLKDCSLIKGGFGKVCSVTGLLISKASWTLRIIATEGFSHIPLKPFAKALSWSLWERLRKEMQTQPGPGTFRYSKLKLYFTFFHLGINCTFITAYKNSTMWRRED